MMARPPPPPFGFIREHEAPVSYLHFASDDPHNLLPSCPALISGSEKGEIFIWNLQNYNPHCKLYAHHERPVLYLNFFNSSLLSQGRDGNVIIWTLSNESWIMQRELKSTNIGFCNSHLLTLTPNPLIAMYNQDDSQFNLRDTSSGKVLRAIPTSTDLGLAMAMTSFHRRNRTYIVAAFESGHIAAYDTADKTELGLLKLSDDPTFCMDFDPVHRNRGISGGASGNLEVWTLGEDFAISKYHTVTLGAKGVNAVRIRPDGKIVVAGCRDGLVRVFSWKNLRPLAVLEFHNSEIKSVAFCGEKVNGNGSVFAVGCKDMSITLWSLY